MLKKYTINYKNKSIICLVAITTFFFINTIKLLALEIPLLSDYYRITSVYVNPYPFLPNNSLKIPNENNVPYPANYDLQSLNPKAAEMNINGEIDLNLSYGTTFPLEKGIIVGAGSQGVATGLKYDLIEKIVMEGSIDNRFFIDFDYDSTRSEKGIAEEKNTYSIEYRGRDDEFVKQVTLGNKFFKIPDSRYIKIDDGNQDSFALRFLAGKGDFDFEGLLRYDVAFKGEKHFKGSKRHIDMKALDVDYVKGQYYFLPDKNIDENSLLIYKSSSVSSNIIIDSKNFKLLTRNVDYTFDNSTGDINLTDPLEDNEELIVYYEKGGIAVGDTSLGKLAIIDTDGIRKDFNSNSFPQYFDQTKTYLYLKKDSFNDYFERRNLYALQDFEGDNIYDVDITLHYTSNGGINGNYDDLLNNYSFDSNSATISFNFNDGTDFYPRPFPGEKPYDPVNITADTNPFDPANPIYGGVKYPTSKNSINTLYISYSYYAESFFLDFNVVPGSVTVILDGKEADPSMYTIDYNFGIIEFKEGIINPGTSVDIYYRYSGFGGGNKLFMAAGGVIYENGPLYLHNLTAYKRPINLEEAPDIGTESAVTLINSSQLELNFGAKDQEKGPYLKLESEAAFSSTNPNVNGSAIVADMESGDTEYKLDLTDNNWMLASLSTILPANGINLQVRGKLFYKNYWESNAISGERLHTLDWNIPDDQIFDYSQKTGPYNSADKPDGGDDKSLVLDFQMSKGSNNPFVSVVYPITNQDLSNYERFNILAETVDLLSGPVEVYVELLSTYNEDLNANGQLDGESSINDHGFSITPTGGTQTIIGSDKYGNSNGKIDSEDINKNGVLDVTSSETGVIIGQVQNGYFFKVSPDTRGFRLFSVSLEGLISAHKDIFQSAEAVRITIVPDSSLLSGGSLINELSGKIVINKMWFSGSEIINNSPDILNIAQLSFYDDPNTTNHSFSSNYPDLYNSLHGDLAYRLKTEHKEKFLDVKLINSLGSGSEASVSRIFNSGRDFTRYSHFKMFIYLKTILSGDLNTRISFYTSKNEKMYVDISSSKYKVGWNEIDITLDRDFAVEVNGQKVGNMMKIGGLNILKRVSEVRFSIINNGSTAINSFEVWLDEWYLTDSKNYFDMAYYIQTIFGYRGDILNVSAFPLVSDSEVGVSYENKEGWINKDGDTGYEGYSLNFKSRLFDFFSTGVTLSKENTRMIRDVENVKSDFREGSYSISQKHFIDFKCKNKYVPEIYHYYERTVDSSNSIVLTGDDFNLQNTKTYNESIGINEWVNLPFGISESYKYSRNWEYNREKLGSALIFDSITPYQLTSLNQIHEINLSYTSTFQSIGLSLKRDDNYTGLYPYNYASWGDSYIFKLKTLFSSPGSTLKNINLYTRDDALALNYSIPLKERIGFDLSLSADTNQNNYIYDNSIRDFKTNNLFSVSFPFSPLKNNTLQITAGLSRSFSAEYNRVLFREDEGDIIINSFKPLFKPPFYYISPIHGLGRIKDYEAVNIYKDSDNILGEDKNTVSNKYELEMDIDTEKWFIPTSFNSWVGGETTRNGDSYAQTRSFGSGIVKQFEYNENDYYLKADDIELEYENQKNYLTKIETNTVQLNLLFNRLKEQNYGYNVNSKVSFSSDIQKSGIKSFYLFPGNVDLEPEVANEPDKYTIKNDFTVEYLWVTKNINFFKYSDLLPITFKLNNVETFRMENEYTFTDRTKTEAFSNIPIRVTLEHSSNYNFKENINFGAYIKLVGGVEEKIIPPYTKGNILPSMGVEFGINTKIIF